MEVVVGTPFRMRMTKRIARQEDQGMGCTNSWREGADMGKGNAHGFGLTFRTKGYFGVHGGRKDRAYGLICFYRHKA